MPTPTKGPRLGGSPAHQKAILANLATNLFEHGAITTTEAKARRLRPFAERLITKAKRGDLHNRRQVMSLIRDKSIVHVLFTEIGPRYAERPGGYTRITKLGPRKGDNAPMAVIELVEAEFTPNVRSTSTATKKSAAGPTAAPATEPETDETESRDTSAEDADQAEDRSAEQDAERADEQEAVNEQDAVASQEPEGETVEPVTGESAEASPDVPSDDASAEDESK